MVRHRQKNVHHRIRLSNIFNDWFNILKFMFNMEKNLSDMKGKITNIAEKTSIITRKMSIIAPDVQHQRRFVRHPADRVAVSQ
ncbi:MAG: hypothetical protein BAA03_03255 [Caldibacillus debilis]|nr:MAG: hypothetical protein BAA03_03255 [Caldibacillus debilis]